MSWPSHPIHAGVLVVPVKDTDYSLVIYKDAEGMTIYLSNDDDKGLLLANGAVDHEVLSKAIKVLLTAAQAMNPYRTTAKATHVIAENL